MVCKAGSAGAVYHFCKACKKKIAKRKAATIQHYNAVDHERNERVTGVGRLKFSVAKKSVIAEVKVELTLQLLYAATAPLQ